MIRDGFVRDLLNFSSIGYAYHQVITDPAGKVVDCRFLKVNQAFEQLTGLKKEKLLGSSAREIFQGFEEEGKKWFEICGWIARQGGRETFETYFPTLKRWFRVQAGSRGDGFFTSLLVDITGERQRENRLGESESLQKALFEGSIDPIVICDLQDRILAANPAMERLFGYDFDKLRGQPFPGHENIDEGKFEEWVRICRSGRGTSGYETQRKTWKGRSIPVSITVSPVMDPEGELRALSFWYRDITEKRQVERELRRSRDNLSDIFQTIRDGIMYATLRGRVLHCNDRLEEILGIPREKLVGRSGIVLAKKLLTPENVGKVVPRFTRLMRGEEISPFVIEYNNCFLEITTSVNPRSRRLIGVIRDVTERIKSEETIRQLKKSESLGGMAAGIAHRYNNLLQVIAGNLEMAVDTLSVESPCREYLKDACAASKKASEISAQMLSYLGHEGGLREPLDLVEVCRKTLLEVQSELSPGVEVNDRLPDQSLVVKGDRVQLGRMVRSLWINARESLEDSGGRISVVLQKTSSRAIPGAHCFPAGYRPGASHYVRLDVTDNGGGIAPGQVEKLFDPFYSTKFTGRGLGLPVVLGILKGHRGCIAVKSRPGRGSTFSLFIPLAGETLPRRKEGRRKEPADLPRRLPVLVVEDENSVADMVCRWLRELGLKPRRARDGSQALEILRKEKKDIAGVICDLTMPGMDGWETIEALRGIKPGLPVILMSGHNREKAMKGKKRELPQAFLQKPFSIQTLKSTLKEVVGGGA